MNMKKIKTVTQKQIEERIERNLEEKEEIIKEVEEKIKNQNLKKGRIRPRDSDEKKILDSFDKK